MTWTVLDKNFNKTWQQLTPFLNVDGGDDTVRRIKKEQSANRAVYRFICDLFGRNFFKNPLEAKINALDEDSMDEAFIVVYKPRLNEAINKLLRELPSNIPKEAHCPGCQCKKPIYSSPTDEQRGVVEKNIQAIYKLAQTFMAEKSTTSCCL
ncbi:MAG TPA: hypothetical protein VLF94_00905 [Chlamydiales bacterium]|nr:hypothetical protein [Chlamydiales bacterium]